MRPNFGQLSQNTGLLRYLVLTVFIAITCGRPVTAQENNQPPKGFIALFNGKDFHDWTGGHTRDPREIAALPKAERDQWDAQVKKGIDAHWHVDNGDLVSDGSEPFLATKKDYGNCEMWVDWKIGPDGDSGIYLRGTPQVQIWDPKSEHSRPHGADKGSGGLWNNKKNERFPSEVADKPTGEWNRMFIRMVGPYVTVELNGKKVVDNVIMDNYYKPELPVYDTGPIYLQTHGSETRFRNVFVREIPDQEANKMLSSIGANEKDFKPLLNGKDLAGWTGTVDSFEVKDGAIVCKPGKSGNLLTEEQFKNCVLRFEFKLTPGGNSGIALRAPNTQGQLAFAAFEIQILDDGAPRYADLQPYQANASLYGLAPATRGFLRPTGEWNYEEITLHGDNLKVVVNGYEVLNANIAEASKKPLDGKEHPGSAREEGHIAICGHNEPVEIRNIRVKQLPSK